MRMRKLGSGHSILFLAPPDIYSSIISAVGGDPAQKREVGSLDILRWAMKTTCAQTCHYLSHWANQGYDYKQRKDAWDKFLFLPAGTSPLEALSPWVSPEARTLEEMYQMVPARPSIRGAWDHPAFDIPVLRERIERFGVSRLLDARMDEEQEREVSHEVERERDKESPPKAIPAQHYLHPDIKNFVQSGMTASNSTAFIPTFSSLQDLHPSFQHCSVWSSNLLATRDFATSIQSSYHKINDYLRPVHWIITSKRHNVLVVLSPFEVNELLPSIRESGTVHLHQYTPRVTQAMHSFDGLRFHSIPSLSSCWIPPHPSQITQINIWAGQLYLTNYKAYQDLCAFLGIFTYDTEDSVKVEIDGWIKPENREGELRNTCQFGENPLIALKELFGCRRKGISYLSTHMGKVLHAGRLTEDDFQVIQGD